MSLKKSSLFGSASFPIFILDRSEKVALPGFLSFIYTRYLSAFASGVSLLYDILMVVLETMYFAHSREVALSLIWSNSLLLNLNFLSLSAALRAL